MYNLERTPREHRFRYGSLKAYEQRFRQARGPNLEFGRAAHWSETPRSGAKWSELECQDLISHFRDLIPEDGRQMSFRQLCELAWNHGSSICSAIASTTSTCSS
jgi:hypothetical protein